MPFAGVVITTGFVHVLGDAATILADPCLGLSGNYPWAFVFATAATLITFCLEYFLQRYFRHQLGLPQLAGGGCPRHQSELMIYTSREPTACMTNLRMPLMIGLPAATCHVHGQGV